MILDEFQKAHGIILFENENTYYKNEDFSFPRF